MLILLHISSGSEVDIDKTENLLLSPSQNQTIPVHIADNNIESPNRFFKLKIKDNSQNSLQSIDPEYLTVEILDNDTGVII